MLIAAGVLGGFTQHFLIQLRDGSISPVVAQESAIPVLTSDSVMRVAEQRKNSVVSIVVTKEIQYVTGNPFFNDPFFRQFIDPQLREQLDRQKPEVRKEKQQVGAGTGFVITSDGLILTNRHVVQDQNAEYTVLFTNDDTAYTAEVITRDPTNDFALLRLKNPGNRRFSPVSFIEDERNIQVGQFVVAIGNALGQFENTVTLGVVSARGRTITASTATGRGTERLTNLLQTDAAINPGNSGGPLVDLSGRVVGINTAVAGGAQSIGFAIPLDQKMINRILDQIQASGRIIRPFVGIRYTVLTPGLNKEFNLGRNEGAWVQSDGTQPAIIADSPAAKAGLKEGDIIFKVNNQAVTSKNQLADLLNQYLVGDTVALTVLRDKKAKVIRVTLEERQE